jgi:hypothetical protein
MGVRRIRFWIELATGVTSAVLAVLTVLVPDWIELSGWDPDNHSGAAEWGLVGCLAVVSVASVLAASAELRHTAARSA